MSISPRLAKQTGLVRDYDGSSPCLPPAAVGAVAERAALKARVERDNAEEVLPSRMSYEELAREMADECRADRAAGHEWSNI
jgi:hypothetical protein